MRPFEQRETSADEIDPPFDDAVDLLASFRLVIVEAGICLDAKRGGSELAPRQFRNRASATAPALHSIFG